MDSRHGESCAVLFWGIGVEFGWGARW